MNKWLEGKIKEQASKKLSEEAVFTSKDVEARFKPVQKLHKKTLSKKAPKEKKPEKEEEKKEDKKEDKKEEKKSEDKKEEDSQKKDL